MGETLPKRGRSSLFPLLMTTLLAIILLLSVFVSSGFSIPPVNAQSSLPLPIILNHLTTFSDVSPYGDILQDHPKGIPFVESLPGTLITEYPDSQPYLDPYQILTPTQTLPSDALSLEEQLLLQENSIVDVTVPETTISYVVNGDNVQLQEGITTTSNKIVLTIEGADDSAVTGFQCSLDNIQQDPSVCSTNPVVAENLPPGAHLFQISSIDAAGNADTTPATFSWNVVVPALDQNFADQIIPQEQLRILPLQQEQQQQLVPYFQPNPFTSILPDGNGTTFYQQQILPQTTTIPSYFTSPPSQYPITDAFPLAFQQPSSQNISTLQQQVPITTTSSLLPFQSGLPQLPQQQTPIANNTNTDSEANQILNPVQIDAQSAQTGVKNNSVVVPQDVLETTNPLSPSFPSDLLPRVDSNNSTKPVFGSEQQYYQQNQTVNTTDITSGNGGNQSIKVQEEKSKMNSTAQNPSPMLLPSKTSNINNTNLPTFATDNKSSDLVASATSSDLTLAAGPTLKDPNLKVQTIATGLKSPTSMAFLGSNDILVLEKNTGMVKRIKGTTILSQPLLDVNVATQSERGLLGIDVQKISSTQYYVFLYYTQSAQDGGTAIANRLYRYLLTIGHNLGPAQGTMTSPKLLLNLPVTPGLNHDGGKVAVSPTGYVYTVLGDLNRNGKAQNNATGADPDLTGGILGVTRDGAPVAGILGSTHPSNKYFAYGIRNSFGIDFDPLTGYLWDTENGPAANDEINRIFGGFNSGWEDIMGMAPAGFDFNKLVNFGGKGVYSQPEFVWYEVVAPTAIEFLNSANLGTQYQNDMFVGDYKKGRIYNFNLNSQRTALVLTGSLSDRVANTDPETQSVIFGEGFGGISDLKVGGTGNGYLYVLSYNGAIYRIAPIV